MHRTSLKYSKSHQGVTLVELMVSLGVFILVVFIAVSALLALMAGGGGVEADRKILDSMSISLADMQRTIRTGRLYRCDQNLQFTSGNLEPSGDCSNSTEISFETIEGDHIIYRLSSDGVIEKANVAAGAPIVFAPLSPSNVTVETLTFDVYGSVPDDEVHARVLISLTATINKDGKNEEYIRLQTTASQRSTDL
ncbi:MAG: hypothetical protein WDZ82_00790 [Candidatus Paceibacterota bacterium]